MFLRNFRSFKRIIDGVRAGCPAKVFLRPECTQIKHHCDGANQQIGSDRIEFLGEWPHTEKEQFKRDMIVLENFLTADEEKSMCDELEPYLQRLRYEFDHWDDAIHGYRETERKHWYPDNKVIIQRVRETAFENDIQAYIHVLDLAEKGVIKPHVDSTRYCGTTIAGLSMLSDSVMRLVRVDETKYQQNSGEDYRNQPSASTTTTEDKVYSFHANIFLARRSLYIMRDTARYNFTHEILDNDHSTFRNDKVHKSRRISIMCRNAPQ